MKLYPFLLEVVPLGQKTLRLDLFVSSRHGFSRSAIRNMCQDKRMLVNGFPAKPAQKMKAGDKIEILRPYVEYGQPDKPAEIALDIVFEDEFLIVINKAAGMAVHSGLGDHGNTLVNALLFHWDSNTKPFLVHRLDKFTSGLIVVAKPGTGAELLAEDFALRKAGRIYKALVWGHPSQNTARIESYIGRHPCRPDSIEISADQSFGKPAITDYELEEYMGPCSLLNVKLQTGRTHQIRVHLHSLGHGLVGDRRYISDSESVRLHGDIVNKLIPGQALHAAVLEFTHPVLGKPMIFSADIPLSFHDLCNYLKDSM